MMATHASPGRVAWIGVRPARRAPMAPVSEVCIGESGLEGDHARPGRRTVTLMQAEHLPVIAAILGRQTIDASILRRNILVSDMNLMACRKSPISIGAVLLEITGPCAPCSRMEEALGPGGFNAMRGHGGLCAAVLQPGVVALGDPVNPVAGKGR